AALEKDPDIVVRRNAAVGLGKIGPEARSAVPALIASIRGGGDSDPAAIDALGAIGPAAKAAAPVLIVELTRFVRCSSNPAHAAAALQKIGPDAVPALVEALRPAAGEEAYSLHRRRYLVANILGKMGPGAREAVPALRELLVEKDESLRTAVAQALKAIE